MIGKWILIFGVVLVVVGALVWLVESLGLPLGRLPGDIRMRGEGWSFSFPIVTCIIVSIVLTVLLNFWSGSGGGKEPRLAESRRGPLRLGERLVPVESGLGLFLKVFVLFLFNRDADTKDRPALECPRRLVLLANGIFAIVADAKAIAR